MLANLPDFDCDAGRSVTFTQNETVHFFHSATVTPFMVTCQYITQRFTTVTNYVTVTVTLASNGVIADPEFRIPRIHTLCTWGLQTPPPQPLLGVLASVKYRGRYILSDGSKNLSGSLFIVATWEQHPTCIHASSSPASSACPLYGYHHTCIGL